MSAIRFVLAAALFVPAASTFAEDSPEARYLTAASRRGVSPLYKKAYEELAQFHRADLDGLSGADSVAMIGFHEPVDLSKMRPAPDNATAVLYSMGIDILPVLVEALDDTTPTKTPDFRSYHGAPPADRNFQVNEIAAMLICAIAHRQFVLWQRSDPLGIGAVGSRPEMAWQFRNQVTGWYRKNKAKTMSERMIDQLSDDTHWNRLYAIMWIGDEKDKAGRHALLEHVRRLPDANPAEPRYWGGTDSELAACAEALGQIGDARDLDTVRRICKYFSGHVEMSALREHSLFDSDVFTAYRGLAFFGNKDEAIKELQRLYDECSRWMRDGEAASFRHELEEAKKWGQESHGRAGEPATGEKKVTPTKPGDSAGK